MSGSSQVAIIEFGSQYTPVIGRSLRELGVDSVKLSPEEAASWLQVNTPRLIILSGGMKSVYQTDAVKLPAEVLGYVRSRKIVVCALCYGMQAIAHELGGAVESGNPEFGPTPIELEGSSMAFVKTPARQVVLMSHGDAVVEVPRGYTVTARSARGIAAMEDESGKIFCFQFHPEVPHTEFGKQILGNILERARCERDLLDTSEADEIRSRIPSHVGKKRAIFGASGGVDSCTTAALVAPVHEDRLFGVTIDGGQLQEHEVEEIVENTRAAGVRNHLIINAHDEFQAALGDVIEPEERRKRFRAVYQRLFRNAAATIGAEYVYQGTNQADKIESGATGAAVIKTHHNVNLDWGDLTELTPIEHLFKFEVRRLALQLNLPERVAYREPSPGPGNFIRAIGVPATPDILEVIRWSRARTKEIILRHGEYGGISQLVVAYFGTKITGVKGDGRVYEGFVMVRPFNTIDFMTGTGRFLSPPVMEEIMSTVSQHKLVTGVMFDYNSKPPRTTEYQ